MSQITLRDYQQKIIQETRSNMINGVRNNLIVLPTGGGKTVIMAEIARRAKEKGKQILFLAHRQELLYQIQDALKKFNLQSGFVAAGEPFNRDEAIQIGSVMTVVNRLNRMKKPSLILCDEAHHYRAGSTYGKIFNHFDTHTVGVTATPCRLSGEPLGDFFQRMVLGPSIEDLIGEYLSPYEIYASKTSESLSFDSAKMLGGDFRSKDMSELMDKPTVTGSAVDEYEQHCYGKQAVAFCVNVEHAKNVAKAFRDRGIAAMSIDGKMDKEYRKAIISQFKSGEVKVLTNCQIVTEGFDLPAMEVVIQLRPTASLSLYLQMVGRGLRKFEGKEKAIILDHAANYKRHGFPCDQREWSLEKKIKAKKKSDALNVKACVKCFAVNRVQARVCQICGEPFAVKERQGPNFAEGKLSKIDKKKQKLFKNREQASAETLEQLEELGRERGYKHPRGWAKKIFQARQAKKLRGGM